MRTIELDGSSLTLADVALAAEGGVRFVLSSAARDRMAASRAVVESIVEGGRTVYGITTGFGVFSEVAISPADSRMLQRNLILSHCAGIGAPYEVRVVRAMMLLRANALARGLSGIRIEVVEQMLTMLERDVIPVIPSQGSVGASGDLAPLAHLAAVLMGVGQCWAGAQRVDAGSALSANEMKPVVYEPKEGLAMINGTQAITAVGGLALYRASMLSEVADLVGAMTLDALLGTDAAFDPRIHAARPHAGQVAVAANLRRLLAGSNLRESHRNCGRVQDAYSLRCMPQVHGAARDALDFVRSKFEVEINAATDNPLIFAGEAEVISGGNFHGAPVALACDVGAITVATLASISERRIERLVNPQLSGLPAFLVEEGGLNSGFMIAQVTAAALVSESKTLAHPASVDSIPTSANKEDHVSMGPIAAWKFARSVENLTGVIAIEALCAAQAIDFHRPLQSSAIIEEAHKVIRARVAPWEGDRYLHADLVAACELLPQLADVARRRS
jgi:histidine ammonia-lyase